MYTIPRFEAYKLTKDEIAGRCVMRGKDWSYFDQDGGIGNLGVVIGPNSALPLVVVLWENGQRFSYQWGIDGRYDLDLVEREIPIVLVPLLEERPKTRSAEAAFFFGAPDTAPHTLLRLHDARHAKKKL